MRASRYRKKPPESLTEEQRTWLADYTERTKDAAPNAGRLRPTDDDLPDSDDKTDPPEDTSATEQNSSDGSKESPSSSESPPTPTIPKLPTLPKLPPPPPPPPPPRVATDIPTGAASPSGGEGSKDWRTKYRSGASDGREQVCLFVAGYWIGGLKAFAEELKLAGVEPMVSIDALAPAIVLTIDELLPERATLTPKAAAVLGSSALIAQRWWNRKEIAEAQKMQEDQGKWNAAKERASHLRVVPDPPAEASPPSPTPTSEPVAEPTPQFREPDPSPAQIWEPPEKPLY